MKLMISLFLMATGLWAESGAIAPGAGQPRKDITVFIGDEVLPHIAVGGTWTTTITLMSLSETSATVPLRFWTTNGQPWPIFAEGVGTFSEFTATFPNLGSFVRVVLPSTGPGVQTGWAEIDVPDGVDIGGHAIFTDRTPGRPVFEAVVPLASRFEDSFYLPWDNVGGNNTCLALANSASFSGSTVSFLFSDETANMSQHTVTVPALSQRSFCLADTVPALRGKRGTMLVQGSMFVLSALAFRFNPGGAFTTFFPMSVVGQ